MGGMWKCAEYGGNQAGLWLDSGWNSSSEAPQAIYFESRRAAEGQDFQLLVIGDDQSRRMDSATLQVSWRRLPVTQPWRPGSSLRAFACRFPDVDSPDWRSRHVTKQHSSAAALVSSGWRQDKLQQSSF